MQALLDDPVVQAGVAPFLAALLIGAVLQRTRLVWFALVAAIAVAVGLSTGITFTPLSAARKVLLLVLVAPLVGWLCERFRKPSRSDAAALSVLCGAASVWAFWSVLQQGSMTQLVMTASGVGLFVALMTALALNLRDDGASGCGVSVALGLAVGVTALLSASIGNFANGIAMAAGGAALLLLQFTLGRQLAPGCTGMLSAGLAASLFAASCFMLAQLPWYALPLMWLVPLAARPDRTGQRSTRLQVLVGTLAPLAAACPAVLAAWLATRTTTP